MRLVPAVALLLTLGGCAGGVPRGPTSPPGPGSGAAPGASGPPATASAPRPAAPRAPGGGGYYLDDGPGACPEGDPATVADAAPRWEPLHRFANRPYTVMGRDYVPATELRPFRERGVASWYGRRFHGQKTSIGEIYDMCAMTAAHPTLPLPSYARVTNLANGRSAVVRVNDRGPFLHGRVIDLSYTAARKLGYADQGSATVEVEVMLPEPAATLAAARPGAAPAQPPEHEVPIAEGRGGSFVQLAAFSAFANAESFLARMRPQLELMALEPRVVSREGLFRVVIGPYVNPAEARRVAGEIAAELGYAPAVHSN